MIETQRSDRAGRDRSRAVHRFRHRAPARRARRRSEPFDRLADRRRVGGVAARERRRARARAPNRPCGGARSASRSPASHMRVGAPMGFTLGALLADVPHTRRTQIIGTATDADLIERFDLERSRYEGPTGIVGVLHDALLAQRPPDGVALGGRARLRLAAAVTPGGVRVARSALHDDGNAGAGRRRSPNQIADYDAQVDALIADDDDLVTYVRRLESMVDEISDDDDRRHRRHRPGAAGGRGRAVPPRSRRRRLSPAQLRQTWSRGRSNAGRHVLAVDRCERRSAPTSSHRRSLRATTSVRTSRRRTSRADAARVRHRSPGSGTAACTSRTARNPSADRRSPTAGAPARRRCRSPPRPP